ncbi:MAG: hypothetical protein AB7G51_15385 [Steroidobacteraceae bacterium]
MALDPLPLGPISRPIAALAEMIAGCQVFQERAELVYPDPDAVEKLIYGERSQKRIWYPSLEDENYPNLLPFAVVSPTAEWALTVRAGGDRYHHPAPEGTLQVFLGLQARYGKDMPASFLDATNYVGQLCRELTDQSGSGGKLSLEDVRTTSPIFRDTEANEASRGHGIWFCALEVEYGV